MQFFLPEGFEKTIVESEIRLLHPEEELSIGNTYLFLDAVEVIAMPLHKELSGGEHYLFSDALDSVAMRKRDRIIAIVSDQTPMYLDRTKFLQYLNAGDYREPYTESALLVEYVIYVKLSKFGQGEVNEQI